MKNLCTIRPVFAALAVFATLGSPYASAQLPSSYDLRTAGPHSWITPTKDQGDLGTCWAFATTTAFQSSLLRQGLVTDASSALLDQSIWHLATRNGSSPGDLIYPYDGWGGDNSFTEAYLTRGRGVWTNQSSGLTAAGGFVSTTSNPLNVYPFQAAADQENLDPYVPPADQALGVFRLRGSYNYDYTNAGPADETFRTQIKSAIEARGAVSVTMFAGGDDPGERFENFYNPVHHTYQVTGAASSATANHMVALAGWDDNRTVYDAAGATLGTGAWLVQNSWGSDWGDGGYFWIAYDDPIAAKHADSFLAGDRSVDGQPGLTINDTVLQNGIYTPSKHIGNSIGTPTLGASRLVFADGAALVGLGLWAPFDETTQVTLSLYDAWNEGPEGNLLYNGSFTLDRLGYQELTFEALGFEAGEDVYALLDFGDAYEDPLALDTESLNLADIVDFSGLSWIGNGTDWTDLSTHPDGGILFAKGITAVPEPGTAALLILAGALLLVIRQHKLRTRP